MRSRLSSPRSGFIVMTFLAALNVSGCGGKRRVGQQPEPVEARPASRLDWLSYEPARISAQSAGVGSMPPEFNRDDELAKIAVGFGLERPQKMDLGVYGKIGKHTVFVAPRTAIPDYDRLYWVMVRVLSEKYGCFIRSKVSTPKIVRFECRDRRTVVLEREISGAYSKFAGRQFDVFGKEIIIKPRAVAAR